MRSRVFCADRMRALIHRLLGLAMVLSVMTGTALAASKDGLKIFDPARVATIRFSMSTSNLNVMLASKNAGLQGNHKYVPAQIDFDGTIVTNVAVRLKGNSSLSMSQNGQYSLKVDFDLYSDSTEFDGIKKLNIHNVSTEASHLADFLSYRAWRELGVPAPRTGWAEVWVNDKKWGTYTTVEEVTQAFISDHFDFKKGDLYKPESPAGNLTWLGTNISRYSNINMELQSGTTHASLIHFLDVINNKPVSEWTSVVDIRGVLTYLSGNAVLGNWDCYTEMGHNYFLYENGPGRFTMLPWDMNFSQGATSALYPPLQGGPNGGGSHPLTDKLLKDAGYKQIYLSLFKDFIEGPASKAELNAQVDYAVNVVSNRLSTTAVKTLRNNIGRRIDLLRVSLAKALTNPPVSTIVINELMAVNTRTIKDESGQFEDWIELKNNGTKPVDLSGMYLTDDLRNTRKWAFPTNSIISPGGFLMVWADEDETQGPLHANFKLDKDSEVVGLYDTDARVNLLVDLVAFGAQAADISWGRVPGTTTVWTPQIRATPGAANDAVDSDGDGLPDSWELFHGLNPRDAADAGRDADGDGVSNLAEFRAETNPSVADSYFGIQKVEPSGLDLIIRWRTEPERDYQLETAVGDPSTGWTVVGLPQRAGVYTHANAQAAGTRFYRVRWLPTP